MYEQSLETTWSQTRVAGKDMVVYFYNYFSTLLPRESIDSSLDCIFNVYSSYHFHLGYS